MDHVPTSNIAKLGPKSFKCLCFCIKSFRLVKIFINLSNRTKQLFLDSLSWEVTIQQFNNSIIQRFKRSTLEPLNHWTIEQLNNWTIEQWNNWTIEQLNNGTIELLNNGTIQPFNKANQPKTTTMGRKSLYSTGWSW